MTLLALIGATVILASLIKRNLINAAAFEYTVNVCRGEHERQCRPHKFFIGCGSVTEWALKRCREFTIIDSSYAAGGRCGYVIAEVTCRIAMR
jgi:hypothetical protein